MTTLRMSAMRSGSRQSRPKFTPREIDCGKIYAYGYKADLASGKGWAGSLVSKLRLTSYFNGRVERWRGCG